MNKILFLSCFDLNFDSNSSIYVYMHKSKKQINYEEIREKKTAKIIVIRKKKTNYS